MKYKPEDIEDWIHIELSVYCTNCNNEYNVVETNEQYFSEDLFDIGWRSTDKNLYCPKCVRKKLKIN